MKKSTIAIIIIIVLAIVGIFVYRANTSSTPSPKVALAQCLADKGAKFYGAYWCPHCNNQKLAFGRSAAKKLPYNECALYPTEVSSVAKKVLAEYRAGTYTGGYLKQLQEAEARIKNNQGKELTPEEVASGAVLLKSIEDWEPTQTEACVLAGVESYPTWIFADGTRLQGEVALEKLAQTSQCTYDDK